MSDFSSTTSVDQQQPLPDEVFRTHPSYPRLQISTYGRYRRLLRDTLVDSEQWGLPKYPKPNGFGYCTLMVYVNRKAVSRTMHQLVLETFVGPKPAGSVARHVLRNDRSDNRLENLAWGTYEENAADRKIHGTQTAGESHPNAKLSNTDLVEIRRQRIAGVPRKEVAKTFGISLSYVTVVSRGLSSRTVDAPDAEVGDRLRETAYIPSARRAAKLSSDAWHAIRQRRAGGESVSSLAAAFDVNRSTIWYVCRGDRDPAKRGM